MKAKRALHIGEVSAYRRNLGRHGLGSSGGHGSAASLVGADLGEHRLAGGGAGLGRGDGGGASSGDGLDLHCQSGTASGHDLLHSSGGLGHGAGDDQQEHQGAKEL